MEIALVYNTKAGGSYTKAMLRKLCLRHGIRITEFIEADGSLARRLKKYTTRNVTVAVIGGDGTVSIVATQLAGTKAVLAPLPGGTLNHFTKDLGIPQDLDEALARLAHAKVIRVDIASVNNRLFINNSSLGLYPSSLVERGDLEKSLGKWPAAVIAAFKAFLTFHTYRVRVNGETFRTPFIFVGNNRYVIDTVGIVERRHLDEGVLSVFIARTTSRWTLLKIALLTLIGRATQLNSFEERSLTSFTIETANKKLRVAGDGELFMLESPVRYKILPRHLKIRK